MIGLFGKYTAKTVRENSLFIGWGTGSSVNLYNSRESHLTHGVIKMYDAVPTYDEVE